MNGATTCDLYQRLDPICPDWLHELAGQYLGSDYVVLDVERRDAEHLI